ncbi:MAG: hypothetical protein ACKVH8_08705 [Pirellulales bacterium]
MNLLLLSRAFREARLLMFGCALTMFGFCMIRVWIVGQVDMSRFRGILEILRPEVERLSSVSFEQIITYPGRVAITYNEPMVIILMLVWTIARGSAAVSGQLSQGTLEMLLAQPISRVQWMLSNAIITVFGVMLIASSGWAGIYVGVETTTVKIEKKPVTLQLPLFNINIPLPFTTDDDSPDRAPLSDFVDVGIYVPSALNLMGLGLFFAGVTTLMSSWDRYRWRTIGIVSGFLIIQMILRVLSLSIEGQEWLAYFTILSWYEPEVLATFAVHEPDSLWCFLFENQAGEPVYGAWSYLGWLLLGSVASYGAAFWLFKSRDLPAPI